MQTLKGNVVKNWLPDELAWLGFIVTAMAGGVVGFIKSYEQAGVETSIMAKVWGIIRRVLSIEYALSNAWGHVLSGIVGMFAAEFFEVLWVVVRGRLQAITGTKQ